jgi:hypothetical protein
MIAGLVIVPDNDIHKNYMVRLVEHQAKYLNWQNQFVPASSFGIMQVSGGAGAPSSPWFEGLSTVTWYTAFERTGDETWRAPTEHVAGVPIGYAAANRVGLSRSHTASNRVNEFLNWNATTNDWNPERFVFDKANNPATGATIDSTTDRVSDVIPASGLPFADGDIVAFGGKLINGLAATIPSEVTTGTRYYMGNVNNTGNRSYQVFRDAGLTDLVDFATNYTNIAQAYNLQSAATSVMVITDTDSFPQMHRAGLIMALRNGHPSATTVHLDRYNFFTSGLDQTFFANFDFDF